MKKILIGLLLLLATALLVSHRAQIAGFLAVLVGGAPGWIALAFAVQLAWQLSQTAQFRACYRLAGLDRPLVELLPVVFANNFVLIAAPSGNASTFALFWASARARQLPTAPVTVALLLFGLVQFASVCLLAALALLALFQGGGLTAVELLPAGLLFAITAALGGLLAIATGSPAAAERLLVALLQPLNRLATRLARRPLLEEARVHAFIAGLGESLRGLRGLRPAEALLPLLIALSGKALLALLLFALFHAFDHPPTLPVVTAGVGMASLFSIISPTRSASGWRRG